MRIDQVGPDLDSLALADLQQDGHNLDSPYLGEKETNPWRVRGGHRPELSWRMRGDLPCENMVELKQRRRSVP